MAILAGQRIRALDFAGYASVLDTTDLASGVTATDWTSLTPVVGVSFTAPTDGAVELTVSCRMTSPTVQGARVLATAQIRTGDVIGSGVEVYTPGDDECLEAGIAGTAAGVRVAASRDLVYSGLTPGSLYHAVFVSKVSSGTGSLYSRGITVKPWHG